MKLQTGLYNKAVYWTDELESKVNALMSKRYRILPTNHCKFKARKLGLQSLQFPVFVCEKFDKTEPNIE